MNYGSLVNADLYNSLGSADQALYTYTADGTTSLEPYIHTLIKKYPCSAGTLYRGLHFTSQKAHDEFLESVKDGTVKMSQCTSWTPSERTARDFSTSGKSYFPTLDLMQADRKMRETGDHMTGYGGVVLKTTVKAGNGCDVTKTKFSKEDEVILPGGTYTVEVHELAEPYHRKYDHISKIDSIIQQIKGKDASDSEAAKLVEYIQRSWLDKLTAEQVDVVVGFVNKKVLSLSTTEIEKDAISLKISNSFDGFSLALDVAVPFDYELYERCTEKMQARIMKFLKVVAKKLKLDLDTLQDQPNFDDVHDFRIHGVNRLRKFLPSETDKAVSGFKRILGDKYHQLNSREMNRTLKTHQDIRAHGERIGKIVSAMGGL